MRIISEFNDFYDCVQAHGQDQGFVYLRKPETVEYDHKAVHWSKKPPGNFWPFPEIRDWKSRNHNLYIEEYIIGFCGKIYPVLYLRSDSVGSLKICLNIEDVDEFVRDSYGKKQFEGYLKPKKRNYWNSRWYGLTQGGFKNFFNECADQQDQHEKIFRDSNSPIFVAAYRDRHWYDKDDRKPHWKPSTITFNAELKEHCFYKVFPTALAYQEISMYLGGVLGQGNPIIPEISNNDMIESKGFDLKTSFRKEKKK